MRLSDADGRTVVSRESAEEIGELKHVVVDAGARHITALHVGGKGGKARLIGWDDVVGFGPDGIVVAGEEAVRGPDGEREEAVVGGDLDLDGRLVLDDRGDAAGSLTDVTFDEASGEIGALVCDDTEIAGERLRAVGPYCIIVRAKEG